jgi:hypothetical protein
MAEHILLGLLDVVLTRARRAPTKIEIEARPRFVPRIKEIKAGDTDAPGRMYYRIGLVIPACRLRSPKP